MTDDTPMVGREITEEELYADSYYVSRLRSDLRNETEARLAALKVIEEYESHSIEQDDRLANLAADVVELRAQAREAQAEASRLRVALGAAEDDRDEARHALRECARELKAAEERLESIRMAGIEASEREL